LKKSHWQRKTVYCINKEGISTNKLLLRASNNEVIILIASTLLQNAKFQTDKNILVITKLVVALLLAFKTTNI